MKKILLVVVVMLCMLSSLSCSSDGWNKVELSGSGAFTPEYKEFMIDDMPCVAVVWGNGLGLTCDWSVK